MNWEEFLLQYPQHSNWHLQRPQNYINYIKDFLSVNPHHLNWHFQKPQTGGQINKYIY